MHRRRHRTVRPPPLHAPLAGLLAAGVLVLGLPGEATAQAAGRGPLVLELPASTGALAMGTAFPLAGSSSDAVFHNPALLDGAGGAGVAAQRYGDAATLVTASGAAGWFGGGVGIGVAAVDYGAPSGDPAAATGDAGLLLGDGPVGASEMVASVGYGARVAGIRIGVAGKLVERRLGDDRSATGAADVGAALRVAGVTAAVAVQNLGPALETEAGDLSLPDRITAGAAFEGWWVGPLDLGASVAVTRQADEEVLPAAGVEVAYWPVRGRTFIARAGLRRVPRGPAGELTLGAAFEGDRIRVEYAWEPFDGTDDAHRIGLRWSR